MAMASQFSVKFCGTLEYATSGGFLYRFIYYFFAMTGQRFFYYTPWCMSDASCIACGIAYDKTEETKDRKKVHHWDRIVNIYIWLLESSATPLEMMKFWNHQIHQWLKHYVQ